MAITGQQKINLGRPNQSTNSDSLYTAFSKIQNNFTRLFQSASTISNVISGNGIIVNAVGDTGFKVTNSGVLNLVAGNNITITTISGTPGSTGSLIINATGGGNGGGGSGTVTRVGITSSSLSVSNSPIISSGNIVIDLPNQSITAGNYRNPSITVDVKGRITTIANGTTGGTVTSVSIEPGSGIQVSGSPITGASGNATGAGSITVTNTGVTSLVAGTGIVLSGSNGAVTVSSTGGGNGGGGTVTRVGVTSNSLSISGSPVVSTGNINIEMPNVLTVSNINSITGNIDVINSKSVSVQSTASNANPTFRTTFVGNNDTGNSWIAGRRALGNISNLAPVTSGTKLFQLQSQGYTNYNQFQPGGGIAFWANGTPTSSNHYIPGSTSIFSVKSGNILNFMTLDSSGNLGVPGSINSIVYSNVAVTNTGSVGRARGASDSSIASVQPGDTLVNDMYYGYTGNGTTTLSGVSGWSFSSGFRSTVVSTPASPTAHIPSDVSIVAGGLSNSVMYANFTHTGNFNIPGVFNGNGRGLTGVSSTTANTVIQSSQPNITSVGSLIGLTSGGMVNFTNAHVHMGGNDQVHINGGNVGEVLTTNGNGQLSWSLPLAGGPNGNNTTIQFNSNGSFAGSNNLTFNGNTLSVLGNLNITGTFSPGNIITTGTGVSSITSSSDINLACGAGAGQVNVTGNLRSIEGSGGGGYITGKLVSITTAPLTSSSPGTKGEIAYDSGFIYVCIATNTWRRSTLASF